jgi:hypothetical protein
MPAEQNPKDWLERAYETLTGGVGSLAAYEVVRPTGESPTDQPPADTNSGRTASQGLAAAFKFAKESRRDADRE